MLAKVVKPNVDGLQDAVKQLLIWTFIKKQDFHTSCTDAYYNRYSVRPKYERNKKWNFNEDSQVQKVDYNLQELEVKKDLYKPHPNVLNRSKEEIDKFHKEHDIQIFGRNKSNCPAPILSFDELILPKGIVDVIRGLNYSKPTPVQSQTWPLNLSGLDMVGISHTGSGKTLGFMLPAIIHITNQAPLKRGEGPIGLVVAPTRELVQQINAVAQDFTRPFLLRTACVYGGNSKNIQRERLNGAHICIATPGRLIDFLREGSVNLSRCTYCVLDEADRLLDMGFEPQIKAIMRNVRPDKQMSMWSATWPKEVRELAESFLKDYIGVKFGTVELAASSTITQHIHHCNPEEKRNLLLDIMNEIRNEEDNKILVFTSTKRAAEFVCYLLREHSFPAQFIHGDLSQTERDRKVRDFRVGKTKILVGTNVVARGLDVQDIKYVINYDFPQQVEEYVHVIGRTGRNNNSGVSHTFFTYDNYPHSADLVKVLQATNQVVPQFLLDQVEQKKQKQLERHAYNFRGSRAPSGPRGPSGPRWRKF